MSERMADTIDAEEGRLVGEASHAAGNLIHRLYYLTELLDDGSHGSEASEALRLLKDALGELHVLVARALALLKPVNVKTIEVDAAAVATSVARRLGAAADPVEICDEREQLRAMPVEVDPGQLDRAIGLLAEAITGRGAEGEEGEVDRSSVAIDVELGVGSFRGVAADEHHGLIIRCKAERNRTVPLATDNHVPVALAVAVATRVLRTFRCDARFEDGDERRALTIFVPASSPYFSKTTPR